MLLNMQQNRAKMCQKQKEKQNEEFENYFPSSSSTINADSETVLHFNTFP
jgi:hypothetical protein